MTVFSLRCSSCDAAVEIHGRLGFKLKNAGSSGTVLCQRCRQRSFLEARGLQLGEDNNNISGVLKRRLIPLTVVVLAVGLIIGTAPLGLNPSQDAQDALPARESPSR